MTRSGRGEGCLSIHFNGVSGTPWEVKKQIRFQHPRKSFKGSCHYKAFTSKCSKTVKLSKAATRRAISYQTHIPKLKSGAL